MTPSRRPRSTPPDPDPAGSPSKTARREAADVVSAVGAATPANQGGGLYGLLVASVRDYAIFALDPKGNILTWNEGAQRIKGYKSEEIIGRNFRIFYPPEDLAWGKTEWELEVAERDGRFEDEGWRIRKDGSRFWASVIITALRDREGNLVGFAKVTRDLTDRRAADEQLRESEERFRLLVQSVRDYAIFMLDPEGHIATWNEGAERIKGYTQEEILGKHFSIFFPPEDRAWNKPAWELQEALRLGHFEDEGWRVRKSGERFWANVIITPLRRDDGELAGFAKVTRDLTERREATQRALEDASRVAAAEAASRAKSQFLAMLSHELRTPLNAIGGYADLLEVGVAGALGAQQRDYVGRIHASQQHLLALINDLLNYGRIEAGHVQYNVTDVSMDDVIERSLGMVKPQAHGKRIALERETCGEPVIARGDQPKIEQIVLNLLTNAVKFTPPDGRVVIACDRSPERAVVRVSDNGPGIPPEKRAEIFEPFVQLERTLTNPLEGTGLGLAISRDLARRMGGDITVDEAPGGGAEFTLTLPGA